MVYENQVCGQFCPKSNRRLVMTLTQEEKRMYSLYTSGFGGGFKSQDWCYETLNERRMTKEFNRHSSQKEHYYKIKW